MQTTLDARIMREREAKVAHLVMFLLLTNHGAAEVLDFTDTQWLEACKGAYVGHKKAPSAQTRAMVVDALAHAASERLVLCQTCGKGNPSGIPGPRQPVGHPGECAP